MRRLRKIGSKSTASSTRCLRSLSAASLRVAGLSPDSVRRIIDSGPFTSADALEYRLIDGLSYRDDLNRSLLTSMPEISFRAYTDRHGEPRRLASQADDRDRGGGRGYRLRGPEGGAAGAWGRRDAVGDEVKPANRPRPIEVSRGWCCGSIRPAAGRWRRMTSSTRSIGRRIGSRWRFRWRTWRRRGHTISRLLRVASLRRPVRSRVDRGVRREAGREQAVAQDRHGQGVVYPRAVRGDDDKYPPVHVRGGGQVPVTTGSVVRSLR